MALAFGYVGSGTTTGGQCADDWPATGNFPHLRSPASIEGRTDEEKAVYGREQIIAVLREHEAGAKAGDLARKHGISETLYNWKAKYGGMDVSDAKRLKALEDENAKLKREPQTFSDRLHSKKKGAALLPPFEIGERRGP
ncbi:transposase [Mesorhizobium loti]|uniref:Transposase n=1 Tax=Rhizobium loti TaxID=381 RepID=A0A8E3B251_RHILI|nr:transposase [Mesorhizobium loti]